jgi:hypothetical protein
MLNRNDMIEKASKKYNVSREFLNNMTTKNLEDWVEEIPLQSKANFTTRKKSLMSRLLPFPFLLFEKRQ